MRTSCIRLRANSRISVLYEDLLEICDGNMLAAMLLSVLIYWTDTKIAQKDENLWIWKSHEGFQEDLMFDKPGMKPPHRTTISSALDLLKKKNLIEWRKNPKLPLDRTRQYLVHQEVIQAAIDKLPALECRKSNNGLSEKRLSEEQASEAASEDLPNVGKPTMHCRNSDNALSEKQHSNVGKPTSNTSDYDSVITNPVITRESTFPRESEPAASGAVAPTRAQSSQDDDFHIIGEFIAERGGYHHPSKPWLKWDSLNAPAVICADLTGDPSEDVSRQAEAIRLRDHLSLRYQDIDLIFETAGKYHDLAGNVVDPLAEVPYRPDFTASQERASIRIATTTQGERNDTLAMAHDGLGSGQYTYEHPTADRQPLPAQSMHRPDGNAYRSEQPHERHERADHRTAPAAARTANRQQENTPPVDAQANEQAQFSTQRDSFPQSAKVEPAKPEQQNEAVPAGKRQSARRSKVPEPIVLSSEARKTWNAWGSLFKVFPELTPSNAEAAEKMVEKARVWCPLLHLSLAEFLKTIKDHAYKTSGEYYRKRGGVKLYDIPHEFEGWQSVKTEELEQANKAKTSRSAPSNALLEQLRAQQQVCAQPERIAQ